MAGEEVVMQQIDVIFVINMTMATILEEEVEEEEESTMKQPVINSKHPKFGWKRHSSAFLHSNGIILLIGYIGHKWMRHVPFLEVAYRYCAFSILLELSARDRPKILGDKRRVFSMKEQIRSTAGYFLGGVIIEGLTKQIAMKYLVDRTAKNFDMKLIKVLQLSIQFVLNSFAYEVIFDFFHYWAHRLVHAVPFLYRNVHKAHHSFLHPTALSTFHLSPLDVIASNSIPNLMTLWILKKMLGIRFTELEFGFLISYKVFVEIAGHTGIDSSTTAFPQCVWLPRMFGMELNTRDHDLHHSSPSIPCNYSKRFTLWDKVFGTYVSEKK